MEEIIYLVIAAGWMLLNIYKKSQEKKQAKPDRRERPSDAAPTTTMEDLMRQLMGKEAEQPVPEVQEVQKPQPSAPSPFLSVDAPKKAERTVKTSWTRKDRTRKNTPLMPDSNEDISLPTREVFDLRKAVVYNAILQRPYA